MNEQQIDDLAGLLSKYGNAYSLMREVLSIWSMMNPIETVGLSDSQIDEIAVLINKTKLGLETDGFVLLINKYLKTQTFAQPHQFTPNWDVAPEWATKCRVRVHWADDDNHSATGALLHTEQRPTPAPIIEVGQVWRFKNSDDNGYKLVALTQIDGIDYAVLELENGQYPSYNKEDFLANFEQVQP